MYATVLNHVQQIKQQRPLILNLTNFVTMDFIANGLLSLGASPIMSMGELEISDLIKLSQCLVINIGTLNESFIKLCEQACEVASDLDKPIIFDPVGAGASTYRTQTSLRFLKQFPFAVIRGNASEIMSLYNAQHQTKGVDSHIQSTSVIEPAKALSLSHHTVIAISGKTDIVIKGEQVAFLERGSNMMPSITGSGCLLSAILGAFHAVEPDAFSASCAAIYFYGVCGEKAAVQSNGPGSFKPHFLDALNELPEEKDYIL